jgi:hypothetical protein
MIPGVSRAVHKAISARGREGLKGCEMLSVPHCPDNRLIDGGEVVSLTRRFKGCSLLSKLK